MEPLTSAIGASAAVRVSPAGATDLSVLFKDGRAVAGEVLETFAGGSVVLGIAGQRVPAQSHVDLQPGQRFLATVELASGEIVLRLAGDASDESSPLVRALRGVLGQEIPAGERLEALESIALRSPALDGLLADLAQHAFTPGDDGEALRALLQRSGLRLESAVLATADAENDSTWLRSTVASELAVRWIDPAEDAGSGVARAIASALLEAGTAGPDGLRRSIEVNASARVRAILERAIAAAESSSSDDATPLLRWLLGAPADDRVRSMLSALVRRALGRDLKARLLGVDAELEGGPARETVRRALASIEADQLMNIARRRFDQAWHFSLPVPDGEHWTSAYFMHLPGREPDTPREEPRDEAAHASQRLTIGIDFSRLGPIRADVLLRERDLLVRLTVERPATAAALRGLVESWRADLAVGGRSVHVAVTESSDVDVELHSAASDVRFLAENHLMDVSG